MKKLIAMFLAVTMIVTSAMPSFAATSKITNEEAAGNFLKSVGILIGDDGDLNLEQPLTREQAMLMVARLTGRESEALNFKLRSTFKDGNTNSYWAPVIAWAESNGLTKGVGQGYFGRGRATNLAEVQTLYLRVLDYDPSWGQEGYLAEEVGLMTATQARFNRGMLAIMTVNTLRATVKNTNKPLAEVLKVDMKNAPKFVLAGDLTETDLAGAKIESAKAIAANKIEIVFDKAVEPTKIVDYKVFEKDNISKSIDIKEVFIESSKKLVITVDPLISGKAYTIKAQNNSMNFTGIAKNTTAPIVNRVLGKDDNLVVVEFNLMLDKASAENLNAYKLDKGNVIGAKLNEDRTSVTLTTQGLTRNTMYYLTIENVLSADLVASKKVTKPFRAIADMTLPKLMNIKYINSETIQLKFSKSMALSSAENISNYTIAANNGGINVISAKASKTTLENDTVILKTQTQDTKVMYTLTIDNLTDDAVNQNKLGKITRTFRGVYTDSTAPVVTRVEAVDYDLVRVTVSEANLMDKASAEDISNYSFDRDITPLSAELVNSTNNYDQTTKEILVKTTPQERGTYRLTVRGIMDEFGNALKPLSGDNYRQYGFAAKTEDRQPPYITGIKSEGLQQVTVKFNEDLDELTAQDPTNYTISSDEGVLGAAVKAVLSKDYKSVTLTTPSMKANKTYTVTIKNVMDRYAKNPIETAKTKFVVLSDIADIENPEISYIYAPNRDEVHIAFNEEMQKMATSLKVNNGSETIALELKDIDESGNVLIFKPAKALVDGKTYTIVEALGLRDLASNAYILDVNNKPNFVGTGYENIGPSTSSVDLEQINVKTLRVTFDKNVTTKAAVVSTGTNYTFNARYDGDKRNVLLLEVVSHTKLENNKTLKFDFSKSVVDMLGASSVAKDIWFTTYFDDYDKPMLVNAIASHTRQIELTFSEEISSNASGTYKVYTKDYNGRINATIYSGPITLNSKDKTIGYISLSGTQMKYDETYYISYLTPPKDLAGNLAETRDFELPFQGTGVVVAPNYIVGVVFNDSKHIIVKDNEGNKIDVEGVYEKGNSLNLKDTQDASTKVISLKAPLLRDTIYEVKSSLGSYDFKGISEGYAINLIETAAGKGKIEWSGYDMSKYTIEVIDNKTLASKPVTVEGGNYIVSGLSNNVEYYISFKNSIGTTIYAGKVLFVGPLTAALNNQDETALNAVTFSFDGADAGKLKGASDRMNYSLDGGVNWLACTSDQAIDINAITTLAGIQLRLVSDATKTKTIAISQANMPIYTIHFQEERTNEDIPATVEYNSDNIFTTDNWIGNNTKLQLTPSSVLYFRTKATGTVMPSSVFTLTVPSRPVTPTGIFLSDKNSTAASIMVTEAGGTTRQAIVADQLEYSLGTTTWAAIVTDTAIDASGSKVIKVRRKATTTTFASISTDNLDQ